MVWYVICELYGCVVHGCLLMYFNFKCW
jgi:hypothetical protein